ncbi:MAG: hypothetical protein RLZZ399_2629 [Verrucomicrobiota bacterium]
MNSPEISISRLAVQELLDDFRQTKHDVNNALAVVIALAELTGRNPERSERLVQTILDRCPKVVEELQDFQDTLATLLEHTR